MVIIMRAKNKLIHGVGINDADYEVRPRGVAKRPSCPIYQKWASMIERCYSEKCQNKNATYKDCTVCEEWLTFSNFRAWMIEQDWEGKELDKDLLIIGNKHYSEDTCIFIPSHVNRFIEDGAKSDFTFAVGVGLHKSSGKFRARCGNPLTGMQEHLGLFECKNKAYIAWKKRKLEMACKLADTIDNNTISSALRRRYL